jgi:hypothetical protein
VLDSVDGAGVKDKRGELTRRSEQAAVPRKGACEAAECGQAGQEVAEP